jgi:NTE family protein
MHMIPAPALEYNLNASSKLNTDMAFLEFLRDKGRAAADAWIKGNKGAIGLTSSIDIRDTFLGRHKPSTPSRVEDTFRVGKRAAS